ncbi:MAG: glycosyltransferase family 2 protein [Bryobacteraceae bacterium]
MRQNAISIVVPVFEEAPNLRALHHALCDVLDTVPDIEVEFVLVDDGSRDTSWNVIRQLHEVDSRVKGVRLSRNFGHQAAVTAGYRYATGDAVVTMDADMQHPPALLPEMIERWRNGFEVVSMVRLPSKQESWAKGATSRLFYRFINALSDVKIKDGVADFRLLDRRVVKKLNGMKERGRFVRGMISWVGFSETEIHYTPAPRFAGKTKYTLGKMVNLAVNAISSFSTAPLRMAFYAGLLVNVLCLGGMGYAVYNRIYENKDLSEWASTFLTMLFLSGMQLLMIGVIGVYVGRIFEEVKQRPVFIAEEKLGIASRRRTERSMTVIASVRQ